MIPINTINTQPVYNDGAIKIKHLYSSSSPVAILQWKPTKKLELTFLLVILFTYWQLFLSLSLFFGERFFFLFLCRASLDAQ